VCSISSRIAAHDGGRRSRGAWLIGALPRNPRRLDGDEGSAGDEYRQVFVVVMRTARQRTVGEYLRRCRELAPKPLCRFEDRGLGLCRLEQAVEDLAALFGEAAQKYTYNRAGYGSENVARLGKLSVRDVGLAALGRTAWAVAATDPQPVASATGPMTLATDSRPGAGSLTALRRVAYGPTLECRRHLMRG
jgi:hypothetical protein